MAFPSPISVNSRRKLSVVSEDELITSLTRMKTWRTLSTASSAKNPGKLLTLTFTIDAQVTLGHTVCLLGSIPELGSWSLSSLKPLTTSAMSYPKWTSEPLSLSVDSDSFDFEFQFLDVESVSNPESGLITYESFPDNRSISFNMRMVDSLDYTINCVFNTHTAHTVDCCEGFTLLLSLNDECGLEETVEKMVNFLVEKAHRVTLKDIVSVCFFFQTYSRRDKPNESDSPRLAKRMIALVQALFAIMTDEIEPLVRKTVALMSKCSRELRKVMRSVTNQKMVEMGEVQLGCRSEAVEDILDEYFSASTSKEHGMLRVIILNSLRRVLKSLRCKSIKPHYLFLYDVWVSELQHSLIETYFLSSDAKNTENLIHQVAIITEFLRIGGVCPQLEKNIPESNDGDEAIRSRLVSMTETATLWLAHYVRSAKQLGKHDYLSIRSFLIEVGADSLDLLFPVISRALLSLPALHPPFSLGLCTGRALGKVIAIDDFDEIPTYYSAVIAVLKSDVVVSKEIPKNVVGIVRKAGAFICSQLVAQCLYRGIVLGVVAEETNTEEIGKRVELRVESEKVRLL